ncbi:hypothetical protein M9H77_23516 [Catharanthus roseus]|uniref:Uncharacterized protein n=1 Tax=Catharanthus roseus TaxID=4058 RepID=A0ACC0AXM9_CATRO|nr:hypothetical protein M9H77_23516 [Catharanthus roseus]
MVKGKEGTNLLKKIMALSSTEAAADFAQPLRLIFCVFSRFSEVVAVASVSLKFLLPAPASAVEFCSNSTADFLRLQPISEVVAVASVSLKFLLPAVASAVEFCSRFNCCFSSLLWLVLPAFLFFLLRFLSFWF